MPSWVGIVATFVLDRIELILLVGSWVLFAVTWFRRRQAWDDKTFASQVNFSLNEVVDGRLRFRTLLESSAEEVWINAYGIGLVKSLARRTTAEQPFIGLRKTDDMDYVKRAVLNVLSEKFATVFLARALGQSSRTDIFVFAITFENYGLMRTRKFRVLIMRKTDLVTHFGGETEIPIQVESHWHEDRVQTLRRMAKLLESSDPFESGMMGRVEMGVMDD